MATYIEIKRFLELHKHDFLGQFASDWIERQLDEWDEREFQDEKKNELTLDDETESAAIHYRAANVLEVLRDDAPCREFFENLVSLTRGGEPCITRGLVELWRREAELKPPVVRLDGR
jgi:hypothetical protein